MLAEAVVLLGVQEPEVVDTPEPDHAPVLGERDVLMSVPFIGSEEFRVYIQQIVWLRITKLVTRHHKQFSMASLTT